MTQSSLLLAFYGDDFSGSTDVMEALALAGVPTALFLEPPSAEQLARLPDLRAVGLAGLSRSLPAGEMERELLPAFTALHRLGAPLVHYKVCSTFDSSPETGSIGRAIDLGRQIFASSFVPLVVGAPVLGRYCVFGNLFARSGGDSPVYRLDQHPTMSRHPVTPMDESDLRLHLARQTDRPIGLFDVLQFAGGEGHTESALARLISEGSEIVLFDVLTESHLPTIGRLIWCEVQRCQPLFAAGSSGLEYALTAHWQQTGLIPSEPPRPTAYPVDRLLVVSGSCSPVTQRQIEWALAEGFVGIPLESGDWTGEFHLGPVLEQVRAAFGEGRSVIVHASLGPDDSRIAAARAQLESAGRRVGTSERLGAALGRIVRAAVSETDVRRVMVTGGDTSGHVARELGIESLELVAPIAPGSPLCRVRMGRPDSPLEATEILFKGGQVGKTELFGYVRRGQRQL